jgi:hypothetical protein
LVSISSFSPFEWGSGLVKNRQPCTGLAAKVHTNPTASEPILT